MRVVKLSKKNMFVAVAAGACCHCCCHTSCHC